MPQYSIFGGRLRSDLPIPELRPAEAGPPNWTLTTSSDCPERPEATLLGVDRVQGDVCARLFAIDGGLRLAFDDTGTFDVLDGSRIIWYPGVAHSIEAARIDITGRVLAVALHTTGVPCLHGSAVSLGGWGVGFLAPKHHGKSTLALALAAAGGKLLTDDTLPVEIGEPVMARPGVHSVRMFSDTATHFGWEHAPGAQSPDRKGRVDRLPESQLMHERVPLAALYLLVPVEARTDTPPVLRTRVAAIPAAMSLVMHAKLGPLLGKRESAVLFDMAVRISSAVPTYALEVVRDFDRIPEVVAQLAAWHGDGRVSAAVAHVG